MLHCTTYGRPRSSPVCFLHGFMGSGDDWTPFAEKISPETYVIAVDLPGHGQSRQRSPNDYTMDGAVEAVVGVLEEVGRDPCSLVGYSMGGRVALSLALKHPNRVERLVLESTSPGLEADADRAKRRRVDDRRATQIEQDLEAFLADWYRQPLFASLERHNLVEEMVATRSENSPPELARALRGLSPGEQASHWERLDEIDMPTLLVTGALDEKYVGITKRTAERMEQARRVVVPDAGHNVHAERPDVYLDELVGFLPVEDVGA